MSIRIAINGYGRIGRGLHIQLLGCPDIEVVAINSGSNAESHAYLLKYDSLYGKLSNDVQAKDGSLYVDGKEIKVYQIRDPKDVDWTQNNVDIVIEATGHLQLMKMLLSI
jgi:glyceraldehyde 3-phosphate dehydrogenase